MFPTYQDGYARNWFVLLQEVNAVSQMNWKVEEVPQLRGFTVEWAENGNYYLSSRNRIYHSVDLQPPFKQIAVVTGPKWKQIASNFRLAQRLLRFMVTNVIPVGNNDLFVTFDKSVGVIRGGVYSELKGLVRPCRVLRSACAVDEGGDLYFGEYLANDERGEMRIYKYAQGSDELEIAYTFPPNSIKHIHGLYYDKFTRSIFCLTGDNDHECQIVRSSDGFKSIEVVGSGDESWRAVSILFDHTHFYYGTDAEFRANNICKVNRKTLEREDLGEVSGTVFYSKMIGDDLFFTTTAENAPSQKENVAALWKVSRDGVLSEVDKFDKDHWSPTFFQFGTIHFPSGNNVQTELYFSLVGVVEDNRTFRCRAA